MVWKSRSNWKKPWSRRKIPAKALPRNVAKKRRQWISVYNNMGGCLYQCVKWPDGNCQNNFTVELLSNDSVQQLFGDNTAIVGMSGSILWQPYYPAPNECDDGSLAIWMDSVIESMVHLRAGLFKTPTSAGLPDGMELVPSNSFDWAETRWLREWNHVWTPMPHHFTKATHPQNSFLGICPDVLRDSYTVPPTSSGSQPTYNVPELNTTCLNITAGGEDCFNGVVTQHVRAHPWWRQSLRSKRRIVMKDSDELIMYVSASKLFPAFLADGGCRAAPEGPPDCFERDTLITPCTMHAYINLKLCIEYG